PYHTRHTFACWLLTAGANPAFIASQMGHETAQMVYEIYGMWIVISCVPIILTSEYLTEASIMALMFGHANALCIGVFISIIYIECWR
ncbi:tyrosine-type recombinase/integrase, partial [Escherichia coli]|uniref:tyrosine-type recombinase/integrase n=1 Tax=Escherichia coli TaxID=562 RepID=UPI002023743A